jgi:hypothetical protein
VHQVPIIGITVYGCVLTHRGNYDAVIQMNRSLGRAQVEGGEYMTHVNIEVGGFKEREK